MSSTSATVEFDSTVRITGIVRRPLVSRDNVLVVGAGIIGIACAIDLQKRGHTVTLMDPEPPGSQTSMGNAGGLAPTEVMPMGYPGVLFKVPGWLFDPLGPLSLRLTHLPSMLPWLWRFHRASSLGEVERISLALSALLQRTIDDTHNLVSSTGMQHLITANGAITVYESEASRAKDDLEWNTKKKRGVKFAPINAAQIREMEPELANVNCGYVAPDWQNTIEPYKLTQGMAHWFSNQGGEILKDNVSAMDCDNPLAPKLDSGIKRIWDKLIICAGVWSADLCRQLREPVSMESERGYNTTLPNNNFTLQQQIIFGDRKFVATQIEGGIRIGGAAEFAGTNAPANFKRSDRLMQLAKHYLPGLNTTDGTKWMGHRPTTPDSLPVISASDKHPGIYYAFGHSHIGLTSAATTASLLGQLIYDEKPDIDLTPFSINRFG